LFVIPAKAGIYFNNFCIPSYAGKTDQVTF
jgi:hypothetical protein